MDAASHSQVGLHMTVENCDPAQPQPEFLSIVPYTGEVKQPRIRLKAMPAEERNDSYIEYEIPYTQQEAMSESARCLQCTCEAIGYYKPRPQAYQTAAHWLQLDPSECLMVAAHGTDLAAAAAVGFRTAFVERPLEWGPAGEPDFMKSDQAFDYVASDFEDLADQLNC